MLETQNLENLKQVVKTFNPKNKKKEDLNILFRSSGYQFCYIKMPAIKIPCTEFYLHRVALPAHKMPATPENYSTDFYRLSGKWTVSHECGIALLRGDGFRSQKETLEEFYKIVKDLVDKESNIIKFEGGILCIGDKVREDTQKRLDSLGNLPYLEKLNE